MPRMSAELVMLKTRLRYRMVDIVLGYSFEFVASSGQFFLDKTPYSEPTLARISEIEVEPSCMRFTVLSKTKSQKYCVNYDDFPEGPILGDLIKKTNAGQGFNLAFDSNNEIDYQSELKDEEEGIDASSHLALSNIGHESIWFNVPGRRIIHIPDEYQIPITHINAQEGALNLGGGTLTFSGRNAEDRSEFNLSWKLDFPQAVANDIWELVRSFVKAANGED